MLNFWAQLILWPWVEYAAHRGFHVCRLQVHRDHHDRKTSETSVWGIVILWLLGLKGFAFGYTAYLCVHHLVHNRPDIVPDLARHHKLHHQYPTCNFAVTVRAVDWFVGTYKE